MTRLQENVWQLEGRINNQILGVKWLSEYCPTVLLFGQCINITWEGQIDPHLTENDYLTFSNDPYLYAAMMCSGV